MTEDWISITEASHRLSQSGDIVERSSLSRYIQQHAEALPIKKDGNARLVDYNILVEHRQKNIRVISPENFEIKNKFKGSQADGMARKVLADAEIREMELAERRKILTRTVEVDRAGRDAISLMQSSFDRAVETVAAEASLKYEWDERTARIVLKTFAKVGLENFNRVILERLNDFKTTETS